MPVLGRPSLEESYPSLANWLGSGPGRVKWAEVAPLVAYGPKVSDSALAMGVLQLMKPGRAVPNNSRPGRQTIQFKKWAKDPQ